MVKIPTIFPPSDLLEQVDGIERGLRQRRRLGAIGWMGALVAAAAQVTALVSNSSWLQQWRELDWRSLSQNWLVVVPLFILLLCVLLISWSKFWLQESRSPFHYTYSIDDFEAATKVADPKLDWLRRDLAQRLSERIARLSLLDRNQAKTLRNESHIHISGSYAVRQTDAGSWLVEITAWIGIGPPDSPASLAPPIRYKRVDATATDNARVRSNTLEPPAPLTMKEYEQIFERVYFSVATQIYRQIRQDVQRKIELLPTNYFRATAYLYEAEDYARSNTLDAYDEAQKLYSEAMRLFDPQWRALPCDTVRRLLHHAVETLDSIAVRFIQWVAHLIPRLARRQLLIAQAEVGYVNMLLSRRSIAFAMGHRIGPIFEAPKVARRAVWRVSKLPEDMPNRKERLFDALTSLALGSAMLGSRTEAKQQLDEARRLSPSLADMDVHYIYARGEVEPHPRAALNFHRRAAELDSKFETAQFAAAIDWDYWWRTRPEFEKNVADIVCSEYERTLQLNPGNVSAWANLGYVYWLQGKLPKARNAYERGRENKQIQQETFVAELDYGLARVAAEEGRIEDAYQWYVSALSAYLSLGPYRNQPIAQQSYAFMYMGQAMIQRFKSYYEKSVKHASMRPAGACESPSARVRDSVRAFVLNDYGEACLAYFWRSYDRRYLLDAKRYFTEAVKIIEANGSPYCVPYYNLYSLIQNTAIDEPGIDTVSSDRSSQDKQLSTLPTTRDERRAVAISMTTTAASSTITRPIDKRRKARDIYNGSEEYLGKVLDVEPELPQAIIAKALSYVDWTQAQLNSITKKRKQAARLRKRADITRIQALPSHTDTEGDRRLSILKKAHALDSRGDAMASELAVAFTQRGDELRGDLQRLLPHKWLWVCKDGVILDLSWDALRRPDVKRDLKLERECSDVDAEALLAWCKLSAAEEGVRAVQPRKVRAAGPFLHRVLHASAPNQRRDDAGARPDQLLSLLRDRFWADWFDVLGMQRKRSASKPRRRLLRARQQSLLEYDLKADPLSFARASWVNKDYFDDGSIRQTLLRLVERPNVPPSLCMWVGDQLGAQLLERLITLLSSGYQHEPIDSSEASGLRASLVGGMLRAYRRAKGSDDVNVLVAVADTLTEVADFLPQVAGTLTELKGVQFTELELNLNELRRDAQEARSLAEALDAASPDGYE